MDNIDLFGRKKIYTAYDIITRSNLPLLLNKVLSFHFRNVAEEDYLYRYRKGLQPILSRKKQRNDFICNKVVVNNAAQVVAFKNGYFLPEPTSYKAEEAENIDKVREFNLYVGNSGKHEADNKIADWFHTVGLGVLYIRPNDSPKKPFACYALDPRTAFVVYSMKPGNEPVLGVSIVDNEGDLIIDAYTKDTIFKVIGTRSPRQVSDELPKETIPLAVVKEQPNYLGDIPIIEYQYDTNRMSSFEVAIPIGDEINNIESNRADGIEQFIQSLMILTNGELPEGTTSDDIKRAGLLQIKSFGDNKAEVKILAEQLDQTQTQVTLNNLYAQYREKTGLPSIDGQGNSSGDNGIAVYLRNGWSVADSCLRNEQDLFRESNRYFERIALTICKIKRLLDLEPEDMRLQFIGGELTNMVAKTDAALKMKMLGFAPEIVFARTGLSNDPSSDIEISRKYIDALWSVEKPQPQLLQQEPSEEGEQSEDGADEQDNTSVNIPD